MVLPFLLFQFSEFGVEKNLGLYKSQQHYYPIFPRIQCVSDLPVDFLDLILKHLTKKLFLKSNNFLAGFRFLWIALLW